MRRRRLAALGLCLLLCIFTLTGCWDKIEIEDRLFVLAMGFDKAPEEKKQRSSDKIDIYFVSPIVAEATKGGKGNAFKTYDAVGESLTEVMRDLLTKSNKKQFFGHCKVIIFGQELLNDSELFKQALDFLGRSHELHKSMYVYATPGKVEDVFKVEPMFDRLLAPYIAGISDNNSYVSAIPKMTLADLLVSMENSDGNGILPLLVPSKDSVEIDRMAIIKNYRLIALTDPDDSRAINRLNGKASGGTIDFDYQGSTSTYSYYSFNRKISLNKISDGKIYLDYKLEAEGSVEGYMIGERLMNETILRDMEKTIEKEIEKDGQDTIKKLQQSYKVDLIGAGEYLRKHQPRVYKEIESDYDNYFADKIVINVEADAKVRRVGVLK